MYEPIFVANNIIKKAFCENIAITPMKLQKILYFLYRDYLKENNAPLFAERFMTWQYGPVLLSVYQEFKNFGASAINIPGRINGHALLVDENKDIRFKKVFDSVWSKCKNLTAIELSRLTHSPNGAWDKAYQAGKPLLSDSDIANDKTEVIA